MDRGTIRCRVLDVDRFGNLQLNVRPTHLHEAGLDGRPDVLVDSAEASALALRVDTYAEVGEGQYGLLEDAWGWVMVIRYEANASGGPAGGTRRPRVAPQPGGLS